MKWDGSVYRLFDILRFPLVLLIVFLHCKGSSDFYPIDWHNFTMMDGYNFLRHYLSNVISCVAVPTFFLMSGYLFYYRTDHFSIRLYKDKIIRRIKTLLVPYFFWNTLFLAGTIFFVVSSSYYSNQWLAIVDLLKENGWWRVFWDCQLMEGDINAPIGYSQDNSAPLLVPMWFVRDLFVVCLFSPILWSLVKRMGIAYVCLLGGGYVLQFWPYIHGVSSVSFFFFSMGIYMCMYRCKIEAFFQKVGRLILISTVLLSLVLVYITDNQYVYQPYILRGFAVLGCLSTLYLGYMCLDCRTTWLEKLSKASFVVYAAHMVFISKYVRIVFCSFMPSTHAAFLLVEYFMVPIVTTCICLLIYFVVKSYFPKMMVFLNGGR